MPKNLTETGSNLTSIKGKSSQPKFTYPKLPASLPKECEPEFRSLIDYMRDHHNWDPRKIGAVEAYLGNLLAIREATRCIAEVGLIIPETGKENPASTLLGRHTGMLAKFTTILGLNQQLTLEQYAKAGGGQEAPKSGKAAGNWSI
ncbi:hypothetical protein [Celeribacter marinus]|uniref:hypothetical protein n=1 Tax=Celeribacter marinus TaxID=1397108 RepID=UPI0031727F17